MKRYILVGCLAFTLLAPQTIHSQFDMSQFGSSLTGIGVPDFGEVAPSVGGLFSGTSLISYPNYPEPYQDFEVELSAPNQDAEGAVIRWYVNGEEVLDAKNARKHSFTALGLGEVMNIKVTLDKRNGATEQKTLVITPTQLDIIIEAKTTIPAFYRGRAVPSRGSEAYASAILHTGNTQNRSDLTYRWELNNKVIGGGAIRGQQGISFTMPLDTESFLTVAVSDRNGVIAEKTLPIRPAQTEVLFYEDHPLRGVTGKALGDRFVLAGNQVTLRAEPYYARPLKSPSDTYHIGWSLNNNKVDNGNSSEINSITLRSSGNRSTASLEFRIVDFSQLAHETAGSVDVNFGQ